MYMDIKIFAKNEKELETLIETIRIFSQYIGMEFDFEKRAMRIMKRGKTETMERITLLNKENIRTLEEKGNYKNFRILEANTIKQR